MRLTGFWVALVMVASGGPLAAAKPLNLLIVTADDMNADSGGWNGNTLGAAPNLDAAQTDPNEYLRCLYDLIFLAFRTDSTRFATLTLESEHSSDSAKWNYAIYALGYKGATHDLAHKRPSESGHRDRWRAEQHAYFLKRLHDTREGAGTTLDRTLVLWGSAHPHASHSGKNYPLKLAGGSALGFRHGKLHAFEGDKKVPLANLFVAMLNALDVPTEKFADSTSAMADLNR